jgi:hypothetical protein
MTVRTRIRRLKPTLRFVRLRNKQQREISRLKNQTPSGKITETVKDSLRSIPSLPNLWSLFPTKRSRLGLRPG